MLQFQSNRTLIEYSFKSIFSHHVRSPHPNRRKIPGHGTYIFRNRHLIIIEYNNKITLHVIKDDIMVDGNPNCCWKRTYLKYEAPTLNDAKVFLNDNFETILKQFNLYVYED